MSGEVAEIQNLRQQLSETENNLQRAAEIGKSLLENNDELNKELDKTRKEMASKIETLEQEKYSLQMKFQSKVSMEQNYTDEIDNLRQSLRQQSEEFSHFREAEHSAKVAELKSQIEALQAGEERYQLTERQLTERTERLEEMLKETQEQLEQKVNAMNETCSEEMTQLHAEVTSLQCDKMKLSDELSRAEAEVQQLQLAVRSLNNQLTTKVEEVEEKECKATSYYNALEKCREEVQELGVQLDLARMDAANHREKGNSLFGELDDKRQEAEKRLISLKVQYDSMKSQYDMNRQHLHKLKMQLAAVLQMSGSRADISQLERLQSQLSIATAEVQRLTEKLNKYEKLELTKTDQILEHCSTLGEMGDKNYVEYMKNLIKYKDQEIGKIQEELHNKRFFEMSERTKYMDCHRKLCDAERQLETMRGNYIKIKLKLDEYKLKYEPGSIDGRKKICKGKVEMIPGFVKPTEQSQTDNAAPVLQAESDIQSAQQSETLVKPRVLQEKQTVDAEEVEDLPKNKDLKSLQKKKVTLSSEVDIIETCNMEDKSVDYTEDEAFENLEPAEGMGEGGEEQPKFKKAKGKQSYVKVIQCGIDAAKQTQNECKTQ